MAIIAACDSSNVRGAGNERVKGVRKRHLIGAPAKRQSQMMVNHQPQRERGRPSPQSLNPESDHKRSADLARNSIAEESSDSPSNGRVTLDGGMRAG
jgi:hypothetical protein